MQGKKKSAGKQTFLKVDQETQLMQFLQQQLAGKSRKSIKALLAHRQVSVNNKIITQFDHPLKTGQEVAINWSHVPAELKNPNIKIVFEDPHLVIVEKQAGLLSVANAKEQKNTAYNILMEHLKKDNPRNNILIVHRLDKGASGLMLFAKTYEAQTLLKEALEKSLIIHNYVAVVQGKVEKEKDTITTWLSESTALKMHSSNVPNSGLKAITEYEVIKSNNKYSLVELRPKTRHKNQVRVHMHDIRHPVIGDEKYGATTKPISRLGLHAQFLEFKHPVTGKIMRFKSRTPQKFLDLFETD